MFDPNNITMDIAYVDILTGENLSSILVAIMDLNYWSVRSSSIWGGDGVKEVDEVYCNYSQLLVILK